MNPLIIVMAIDAAMKLLDFVVKAREQASRTAEWTPEQAAEIDAKLAAAFAADYWKPRT